jgi:hypothetical protein
MRKYWWVAFIAIIGMFTIFGCSSSSNDDNNLTDYRTGDMVTLGAVSPTDVTLQAATADTHEVETDGNWIVWKGRSINVSYYDGRGVTALAPEPGGAVVPWAFDECDDSPVAFDGTTIVTVANDAATVDLPKFYYYVPGDGTGGFIDLPFDGDSEYPPEKDLQDNYSVYVSGNLAVVSHIEGENGSIYRADLSEMPPTFTEFEIDNEPITATGVYLAVIDDGDIIVYDMSAQPDVTSDIINGDDDELTDPEYFRSANGIFTWVEDGIAYYYEPGVSTETVAIYNPVEPAPAALDIDTPNPPQRYPVAGPDYFLWHAGDVGSIWYLAKSDVGSEQPTPVAYSGDLDNVETGDGFFAYMGQDDEDKYQIFVYDLSGENWNDATAGRAVTQNGEGVDYEDSDFLRVDGTKIYDVFEYRDVNNPSRVLVMYDVATDTLKNLTGDRDFQQVAVYAAAGGKAVFLHRDHSFRLFAKQADQEAKPVTLTPADLRVENFSVANGVVAFMALDRGRYLDDDPALWGTYGEDGYDDLEFLSEVYYIDLDGARDIKKVTDNEIQEKNPQTDGDFITWYNDDDADDYDEEGDAEDDDLAYAYKIATKETTLIGTSGYKVSVDGGIAVWRDSSDDIYYYNLNTGENGLIYSAEDLPFCPTIANGVISWTEGPYSASGSVPTHAMYYNLNAETPTVVTITDSHPSYKGYWYEDTYAAPTRNDGTYLTWVEFRDDWDYDEDVIDASVVVVYDIANETMTDVPADFNYTGLELDQSSRKGDVCFPQIFDGVVVFSAFEYGAENSDGDKEVFYYDLNTEIPALVQLTTDDEGEGLWDSRPRIANGLIVWRTGGSSYWDWKGKSVAAAYVADAAD